VTFEHPVANIWVKSRNTKQYGGRGVYFKTLLHPGLWGLYQIIEQSCNTLKHFDTEAPHLCNRVPSRHASLNFLNWAAHAQYDVYRLDLNANENDQLSYYTNKTIRTTTMLKWNICLILSNTFRFSLRTLQDSTAVLLSCTFWTITIKSYTKLITVRSGPFSQDHTYAMNNGMTQRMTRKTKGTNK
jgi:hypothetical protein